MHLPKLIQLLQRKRATFAIGLSLALLPLSLIPLDFGRADAVIGKIADAGHLGFYGLISLVFSLFGGSRLIIASVLSLISALIECVQPFVDRDGSVQDFFVSSAGAFFGSYWLPFKRLLPLKLCIGLALSIFVMIPIYQRLESLKAQEAAFPNLLMREVTAVKDLWVPSRAGGDNNSLLTYTLDGIEVTPIIGEPWPGIVYRNFELPWSGYQTLRLEISSHENQELGVRIDDDENCKEYNDRFNGRYPLVEGENVIDIPLSQIEAGPEKRNLNLDHIRILRLFVEAGRGKRGFTVKQAVLVSDHSG